MKAGVAPVNQTRQENSQSNDITILQEDISAIKEQMESQREEHQETQTKLTSLYDDVMKNVESEMKETQG